MSAMPLLSLAVLLFASLAAALPPRMPYPPLQYSAIISYNVQDKGYTVAYPEWFDYDLNQLRFDGRIAPLDKSDVISFDTSKHYQFFRTAPSPQCKVWSIENIDAIASNYYSLSDFIGSDEYNPKTFIGTDTSARNIPCNVWRSSKTVNKTLSTSSFTSQTTESTYFYSLNSIYGNRNVPIRIILRGNLDTYTLNETTNAYYVSSSAPFYHNIDVVQFIPGALPKSTFVTRANADCVSIDPPTVSLPTESTITPVNPASPPTLPAFPKKFVTYLEAKLSDDSNVISSVRWIVDLDNKMERIDEYNTGLLETVTTIYKYKQGTDGFLYKYLSNEETCSSGILSETGRNPNTSPFARVRAGSIPNLFAGQLPAGLTYQGRVSSFRGLIADSWVSNTTVRTRAGVTYTYNTTLYFSVDGWQFPGRGVDKRIPFRIVNMGSYVSVAQPSPPPVQYTDIWDFYLFVDTIPDASVFDEKLLGCPDAPTILQELIDQSLRNGKIAGAIIGVLGGLTLVAAGGFYVYTRFFKAKSLFGDNIELAGRDSLTNLEDM